MTVQGATQGVGERFFALSRDLMCIADSDATLVAVNPAWQRALGWPVEKLIGTSYADVIHPDDIDATVAAQTQALGGESVIDFTNRVRTFNGNYLWILWTATTDSATGLTYAVGKDVTARTEDELRLAWLAAVVEQSDDAIVTKDLNLTITTWNTGAERLYGYTPQEITGCPFATLIPPDRDGEDRMIINRVLAGETVDHFETVRVHKDGKRIDVSVTVSALYDSTGRIVGASSIARDIRESRALLRTQEEVIKRLLLASEYRDDTTGQHIVRMAHVCGQVATVLGWEPTRVAELESAATMHDVGKIAIPDSILLKPGALSEEERAIMQTHTEIGHRMLSNTGIDLVDLAAEIALTHHEHFDGNGYPSGLSGHSIPLCGRIAAVADVFDALTNDRPYRPAFTTERTLSMMRAGSGTQFDPTVLAALLRVVEHPPPSTVDGVTLRVPVRV
jgi:PAS domain S-box-containing protein